MTAHGKRSRGRSKKRRRVSATHTDAPAALAGSGATGAPEISAGAGGSAAPARDGGESARSSARTKAAVRTSRRQRARSRGRSAPRGRGGGFADLLPAGQRPQAPWHPLPLSELLILVGAIGAIVGLSRGISHGAAPLIAGLVAVAIGTVEVTLREHLSGYRSHTIMLAALPVIALDSSLVLLISPFGTTLKLGMLALDIALFVSVYRLLRARFLDARRERVFSGGR